MSELVSEPMFPYYATLKFKRVYAKNSQTKSTQSLIYLSTSSAFNIASIMAANANNNNNNNNINNNGANANDNNINESNTNADVNTMTMIGLGGRSLNRTRRSKKVRTVIFLYDSRT